MANSASGANPFDAIPNLRQLIANDEGVAQAKQSLLDTLKGAILGNTVDAVAGLVDPINPNSPLGSKSLRETLGIAPQEQDSADVKQASLLSGLLTGGPPKAAALSLAAGLAKAKGVLPFLLGAIRPRGRPDLSLVHNMTGTSEEIYSFLRSGKPLGNPSIAVAKDPFPFDQTPTLVFNPSSKLLDPKLQPQNQLFNRDAYTSRLKNPILAGSDQRLAIQRPDLRFTEMGGTPGGDQQLAIALSPDFRSFQQYERSPAGADTLRGFGSSPTDRELAAEAMDYVRANHEKIVEGILKKNPYAQIPYQDGSATIQHLTDLAGQGDRQAAAYLRDLQRIGSDYGELKVIGNVPIEPRNVNALLLPTQTSVQDAVAFSNAAKAKGIPVGLPNQLASPALRERTQFFADKALRDLQTQAVNGVPYEDLWLSMPSGQFGGAHSLPPGIGSAALRFERGDPSAADKAQGLLRRMVWNDPVIMKQLLSELGTAK